jgi:hypothetical protein
MMVVDVSIVALFTKHVQVVKTIPLFTVVVNRIFDITKFHVQYFFVESNFAG